LLSSCGGGGGSNLSPGQYLVGGTVTGLASGTSVALRNGAGDTITVSANGSFTFSTPEASGASYAVTVLTPPTGQTCSVIAGSGTVSAANVTSVHVDCSIKTFTISGTVSGLNTGAQVTVQNNAGDSTTLNTNGPFSFATPIPYNGSYAVTVAVQPLAQSCTVSAGSGTMVSAQVSGVRIACGPAQETVIHAFDASPDGIEPIANLIQGSDGNLYGTTDYGGTGNIGTVFKITPAGAETVLYSFAGGLTDGSHPVAALIEGSDGNFYGTTTGGGPSFAGTVFKITPAGVESVLYAFAGGAADGSTPTAALVLGSDGNFYGTTSLGGPSNYGTVFRITPAGAETVLYAFAGGASDGSGPGAALIQASDGNFYGTTAGGGTSGGGTVFKIAPSGFETVLYAFAGTATDGSDPGAALIQAGDGNFYGTTSLGGTAGVGTVFKVTPAGVETILHSFTVGTDGRQPVAALIQASDGNFYGTTYQGGSSGDGVVFKVTPAGVETVFYAFTGAAPNGNPRGAVIQDSDGNFYGATAYGGTSGSGTVFKITPTGSEAVLHSFSSAAEGQNPVGLIQGSDGSLYGTTSGGGTNGHGTVFKITPAGVETAIYSFAGGPTDGDNPTSLVQGSDGNLYGTTLLGGTTGNGTVFKFTPAGVERTLYSFASGTTDGSGPSAALIQASDGNFYGTTTYGGASGNGTVFKITPAGVETVLYSFAGGTDANQPLAGLTQASDGIFYGTSFGGGTNAAGTVFKITAGGVETVLHSFAGSDGAGPNTPLIQGSDGNFYGATSAGGTSSYGTVFKITPSAVETVLYSFAGGADGAYPVALIQGGDGNYYGATHDGGPNDYGTLFKVTPTGLETVLYTFSGGSIDGAYPAALILGSNGILYGTSSEGGSASNLGTVFEF